LIVGTIAGALADIIGMENSFFFYEFLKIEMKIWMYRYEKLLPVRGKPKSIKEKSEMRFHFGGRLDQIQFFKHPVSFLVLHHSTKNTPACQYRILIFLRACIII
jgi:hypothetical protein